MILSQAVQVNALPTEERLEWDSSVEDKLPQRIKIEFTIERRRSNRNVVSDIEIADFEGAEVMGNGSDNVDGHSPGAFALIGRRSIRRARVETCCLNTWAE